jgi:hypothetical protein
MGPLNMNCPRSLRDIRTASASRVRAKPSAEGQRYLDLYVLQRDRTRWSRVKRQAEQTIQGIDKALAGLGFGTLLAADRQGPEELDSPRPIALTARPSGTSA